MSDVVIKAENIGKKYTIGHQAERGGYTSLRDVLMQMMAISRIGYWRRLELRLSSSRNRSSKYTF